MKKEEALKVSPLFLLPKRSYDFFPFSPNPFASPREGRRKRKWDLVPRRRKRVRVREERLEIRSLLREKEGRERPFSCSQIHQSSKSRLIHGGNTHIARIVCRKQCTMFCTNGDVWQILGNILSIKRSISLHLCPFFLLAVIAVRSSSGPSCCWGGGMFLYAP